MCQTSWLSYAGLHAIYSLSVRQIVCRIYRVVSVRQMFCHIYREVMVFGDRKRSLPLLASDRFPLDWLTKMVRTVADGFN